MQDTGLQPLTIILMCANALVAVGVIALMLVSRDASLKRRLYPPMLILSSAIFFGIVLSVRVPLPFLVLAALMLVVMITLLVAALILVWARATHKPWRDLGFVRPRNWAATILGGVVIGVVFKLGMKAIVMPLLGGPEINQTYHYLVGNPGALAGMIFTSIVIGGFGEELVYRGFLFDRLGRLLGHGPGARVAMVLVTTALFSAMHYPDQGFAGVEQAVFSGLVLGTILALTGGIWLPMVIHAAFDLTAVAIIYLDLESWVAHLVFKPGP